MRTDETIFKSFEANQFYWQHLILEVLLDIRRAVCKKPFDPDEYPTHVPCQDATCESCVKKPYVKPEIKSEPRH